MGASGCGKTTLLNCIVGRKRLNSGEIWVLGGTPGSRGSGVPGPRIGYMPQEIALYGEFTIRETFQYFGWISEMSSQQVDAKLDFYVKFLMLPDADRQVKNLSGGQQRRVSLAVALIHEPELLILDEPTVGVDPVLRQSIWNHLVEITKHGNTTVIITTHYIDETRQAHMVRKTLKNANFQSARYFVKEFLLVVKLSINSHIQEDNPCQKCVKPQNNKQIHQTGKYTDQGGHHQFFNTGTFEGELILTLK